MGEIRTGVLKIEKKDKEKSVGLRQWLDTLVVDYAERIIGINLDICEEWAELMNIDGTNAIDSLIAAQARQTNMMLVIRNVKHYRMFDVHLLNPFDINI